MTTKQYLGTSDNPGTVVSVYYDTCDGEGTHPEITYVASVLTAEDRFSTRGGCPACAGAMLARYERQEATGC